MRFLVYADLPAKGIDYSRQHLKRLVADGKFPAPVKGICRENCWPEPVIDKFVEDRIAAAAATKTAA